MEDTLKPLCPPFWLSPIQWKSFEAAGYDMQYAQLVRPLPVTPTTKRSTWTRA